MNVEDIKHVIVNQHEEIEDVFNRERIIERDVPVEDLRSFLTHPNILTILGVRRCGKSLFTRLLLKDEEHGYINFFDERLAGIEAGELKKVLQAFYELNGNIEYLVFDEIQNVPGWERFVSRLRTSKKIVITGSNSQLLSGELATFLTGRHVDFTLFPFNLREHLALNEVELKDEWTYSTRKVAEVKRHLERHLLIGGFPEVHRFGGRILQTIYSDIIENDVLNRYKIRKTQALRELARYSVSNFSNEITFSKLKNTLRLKDAHTVSRYMNHLTNAYLFFLLERFSFKLKEQFLAPKKIYCIDPGLIHTLSFRTSENRGGLMENLTLIELLRRKSYEFRDQEIYYWKDHQGKEVDFILKEGTKVKELIQVCYDPTDPDTRKREVKALVKASKELQCKDLKIITWDHEEEESIDGKKIVYTPLWKWLLVQVHYPQYLRRKGEP